MYELKRCARCQNNGCWICEQTQAQGQVQNCSFFESTRNKGLKKILTITETVTIAVPALAA